MPATRTPHPRGRPEPCRPLTQRRAPLARLYRGSIAGPARSKERSGYVPPFQKANASGPLSRTRGVTPRSGRLSDQPRGKWLTPETRTTRVQRAVPEARVACANPPGLPNGGPVLHRWSIKCTQGPRRVKRQNAQTARFLEFHSEGSATRAGRLSPGPLLAQGVSPEPLGSIVVRELSQTRGESLRR
jgi:hypothetical protein